MGGDIAHPHRTLCTHRLERRHGIGASPCQYPLSEEHGKGQSNHNDADRRGKSIVAADLSHELRIDEDRHRLVALADQHGRTKVGKDAHKDEQ